MHIAFGPDWFNSEKEFFEIDAAQAIAIIELELEDVTPKMANKKDVVDELDLEAEYEYARKKRPRFSFNEMNISQGSELNSVTNGETVTVVLDPIVIFQNEETSLTNAIWIILDNDYHVAPGPY